MQANVQNFLPRRIAETIQYFSGRAWLLPELVSWFEKSDKQLFLLQGGPGTGKSSIIAWLSGAGPPPDSDEPRQLLTRLRSAVKATHFCISNTGSIVPKTAAENISMQLAANVEGFGEAMKATLSNRIQISNVQIGNKAEVITGVDITLHLGGLDDDSSFNLALRDPLRRLYSSGHKDIIIILIDALDEALTYTGSRNLVQFLSKLDDLPKEVRLIVTTRPDPRVLKYFRNVNPFDLVKDAPAHVDDIQGYVIERMYKFELDQETRMRLARKISVTSEGNFLYAHLLFSDILPHLPNIPDFVENELPRGLAGLYSEFLDREIGSGGAGEDLWFGTFRPLLGLIAVSQGSGFTKTQLASILGKDIEQPLRVCKQYLEGELPEGPFRIFHKSFEDYLLDDTDNLDYHIDPSDMDLRISCQFGQDFKLLDAINWQSADEYALRYLPLHISKINQSQSLSAKEKLWYVQKLFDLASSEAFATAQRQRIQDEQDLSLQTTKLALSMAIAIDDPISLARFLLSLSHRISRINFEESPLGIVKKGDNMKKAWQLADLHDNEVSILWHLLIAWALADKGRVEDAQVTLARKIGENIEPSKYVKVPRSYLVAANYETSPESIEKLYEYLPNAEELAEVCGFLIHAGHLDGTMKLISQINDARLDSSVINLVDIYLHKRDFSLAATVAGTNIVDPKDRCRILLLVASAQIRAALRGQAHQTLINAKFSADRKIPEHDESVKSLSDVALLQAQAGYSDEAKETFQKAMKTARVLDNESLYAKIATAQAQAGFKDDAKETFDLAIIRCKRKDKALAIIAAALAQVGNFDQALRLAESMRHKSSLANTFANIGLAFAQQGFDQKATEAFRKAVTIAEPLGNDSAFAYISAALAKAGNLDQAIKLSESIRQHAASADALAVIAYICITGHDYAKAVKVASFLPAKFHDKKFAILKDIAIAQMQSQMFGDALEVVKMTIGHDFERIDTIRNIALAQAQAGYSDEAKETFADGIRIAEVSADAPSLAEIALAQAQAGYSDEAKETFQKAMKTARVLDNESLYAKIATAQAQAGFKDDAKETFDLAIRVAGAALNPQNTNSILKSIATVQARSGDFESSLEIAISRVEDPLLKARILEEICCCQIRAKHFDTAIQTARIIGTLPDKWVMDTDSFVRIGFTLGQAASLDTALQISREIESYNGAVEVLIQIFVKNQLAIDSNTTEETCEMARSIIERRTHSQSKAATLAAIAVVLGKVGSIEESKQTFGHAVQTAESMTELTPSAITETFLDIATAQAQAGFKNDARETFQKAFEEADRQKDEFLIGKVATAQRKAGFKDEGTKTIEIAKHRLLGRLSTTRDYQPRRQAISEIVRAEVQAENFDAAIEFLDMLDVSPWDDGLDFGFEKQASKLSILLEIATAQAQAGFKDDAKETFQKVPSLFFFHDARTIRGEADTGLALSKAGFSDEAKLTFESAVQRALSVDPSFARAEDFNAPREENHLTAALNYVAKQQVAANLGSNAIETLAYVRVNKSNSILMLAELLIEKRDLTSLKTLFTLSSNYLQASYGICAILSGAYPEKSKEIAGIVTEIATKNGILGSTTAKPGES